MRQYPRVVHKGKGNILTVKNEQEEYEASLKGYERHWNPEINKKEKGTAKEILREIPKNEADLIQQKLKDDAIKSAKEELLKEYKEKAEKEAKEEMEKTEAKMKAEAKEAAKAELESEAKAKTKWPDKQKKY